MADVVKCEVPDAGHVVPPVRSLPSRDLTHYLFLVLLVQVVVMEGHDDFVNCIAFSLSGDTVASGSDDGTIRIWSVDEGQQVSASLSCWVYIHLAMSSDQARGTNAAEAA